MVLMPLNTILIGMNHFKDQSAVLALPDEEYPSWLWKVVLQVRVAG